MILDDTGEALFPHSPYMLIANSISKVRRLLITSYFSACPSHVTMHEALYLALNANPTQPTLPFTTFHKLGAAALLNSLVSSICPTYCTTSIRINLHWHIILQQLAGVPIKPDLISQLSSAAM